MDPGRLGSRIAKTLTRLMSRTREPARAGSPYPGDYTGAVDITYSPHVDGDADPGEVVWGWIPYEDDHRRGKDRPSLVIGRDGRWLLVLMLTSRDKASTDAADNRSEVWVDIGSGPWDRERRPSEVRVDRVIRLAQDGVRREGAVLDRDRYDAVAAALRRSRDR